MFRREQSEPGSVASLPTDVIDISTFEQILGMDDSDEDRDFSKGLVYSFFSQAESTFQEMDENFENKDILKLSSLGHFLKGSSAALGLTKLKDSCEKIQNLGTRRDETGMREEPDMDVSLKKLLQTIRDAKNQFGEAERALKRFFGDVSSQEK
ncbi:phosphotransmitter protein Ypd1 [Eremomyces bilateralis CBS 781.70]|uniref:Phosphotransmitter protein Ypd1 n=1 Tax=Eremomyces bilateralis CBS 781.70 TaxID=1392243 RepID=A0A6G1FSI7_9PEZI|nr:phosphotransmitter protein Ypd1 [Eremomyces bilateralis CBS 781.70]KAF1808744.1 phosphotransmitter protein Ypd1 [Eremomyces bilateralis CBS 781.70]